MFPVRLTPFCVVVSRGCCQLERKKKEGTYKTKKQKEQEARAEAAKAAMLAAGLEGELRQA